ncbi:hypothetical protein NHX12_020788 [Muraenolepis orangiensis]|uniref:Uncharacterized protein n=1 Tax=Muraenolepis orangiensis TaxID=630683 RepID=A0A9Q0EVY9_9TELE|nr:hypothetical protein NHX12_020788 [Muraenolepis orangiensis]
MTDPADSPIHQTISTHGLLLGRHEELLKDGAAPLQPSRRSSNLHRAEPGDPRSSGHQHPPEHAGRVSVRAPCLDCSDGPFSRSASRATTSPFTASSRP